MFPASCPLGQSTKEMDCYILQTVVTHALSFGAFITCMAVGDQSDKTNPPSTRLEKVKQNGFFTHQFLSIHLYIYIFTFRIIRCYYVSFSVFAGWFHTSTTFIITEHLCNSVSNSQSKEVLQAEFKPQNPIESHSKYIKIYIKGEV